MHINEAYGYLDDFDVPDEELGFNLFDPLGLVDIAKGVLGGGGKKGPGDAKAGAHGMSITEIPPGPTQADKMTLALANKPRIQARSVSSNGTKDAAMISAIATRVRSELAPELTSINARLGLADNQREATSEHKYLNNTEAYRKKVIGDLMAMRARMPADDPRRGRIMRVGLLSGFM